MAGDWTRIRSALFDDPRVLSMAASLNLDPDDVVGKLARTWLWAGDHTTNGAIRHGTMDALDSVIGAKNFSEAMAVVGWLEVPEEGGLRFPRWDKYNAQSAKSRLKEASRKALYRQKSRDVSRENVPQMSHVSPVGQVGQKRDGDGAREEKRREEKSKNKDRVELPDALDTPEFSAKWAEWLAYKAEKRQKMTPITISRQLAKFEKCGVPESIRAIDDAIEKGWTGAFPKSSESKPDGLYEQPTMTEAQIREVMAREFPNGVPQ